MGSVNAQADCSLLLSWLYNMHCACDYHWLLLYPVQCADSLKEGVHKNVCGGLSKQNESL